MWDDTLSYFSLYLLSFFRLFRFFWFWPRGNGCCYSRGRCRRRCCCGWRFYIYNIVEELLPTAYVVQEEVIFSVCLSVHTRGGYLPSGWWGGGTYSGLDGGGRGGTYSGLDMGGGYLLSGLDRGGVPTFPGLDRGGVPTFPGLDGGGTYLPPPRVGTPPT